MAGAVTLSDIWMFQISLSPCAEKLANSFGMIDTSRISWPRKPKPRAMFAHCRHRQPRRSRDQRPLRDEQERGARAQMGIHRVDADGENAHEDLVRPWLGRRHLLELEDRGAAILGYANGLHGQGSFRWRVMMGAYLLSWPR